MKTKNIGKTFLLVVKLFSETQAILLDIDRRLKKLEARRGRIKSKPRKHKG